MEEIVEVNYKKPNPLNNAFQTFPNMDESFLIPKNLNNRIMKTLREKLRLLKVKEEKLKLLEETAKNIISESTWFSFSPKEQKKKELIDMLKGEREKINVKILLLKKQKK